MTLASHMFNRHVAELWLFSLAFAMTPTLEDGMQTLTAAGTTPAQPQAKRHRMGFFGWVRRVLLGLIILLVALASGGTIYQAIATARDNAAYPHLANSWMSAATSCTSIASAKVAPPLFWTAWVMEHRCTGHGCSRKLPKQRVDQQHAAQMSAAVVAVVEAARTGQPLARN
jgi:hypothetical protein